MILLLNQNEKIYYKTVIHNEQELKDLRKRISQFNDKNYEKIGTSSIEETDVNFIKDPYYNRYYDFYYVPISNSSDKFIYTNNYTVKREVYRSNYQIVLRLISSIFNNDPKDVDLTGIIGNYISIDELLERREKFREQIANTKYLDNKVEEHQKRQYNLYSYVVKCLTCVQLEKTNYKIKEKGKLNRYGQAA